MCSGWRSSASGDFGCGQAPRSMMHTDELGGEAGPLRLEGTCLDLKNVEASRHHAPHRTIPNGDGRHSERQRTTNEGSAEHEGKCKGLAAWLGERRSRVRNYRVSCAEFFTAQCSRGPTAFPPGRSARCSDYAGPSGESLLRSNPFHHFRKVAAVKDGVAGAPKTESGASETTRYVSSGRPQTFAPNE